MRSLDLKLSSFVPKLLYKMEQRRLILLVFKIMDDFLVTGEPTYVESYLAELNKKLTLETIVHGPGNLHFFGQQIL